MLLKENFYKRRNEKAWSLWLLPLVILSCFVFSIQSFAQSSSIKTGQSSAISITTNQFSEIAIEKDSYTSKQLKALILQRGVDDKTLLLIAKILSRPNWQKHSAYHELKKALIEKGNNEVLKVIEAGQYKNKNKNGSYTSKQLKALILKTEVDYKTLLLIAKVLFRPNWQKHSAYPELMKALIAEGDNKVLMAIVENISFSPQTESDAELVKALIEKAEREVLIEIAEKILSHPDLMEHPDLVKALIERAGYISHGKRRSVREFLSKENYNPSPEHEVLERFMHTDILMRVVTILSQPGWEKHPDLLKALIENAGPYILHKIARDVLSQLHWLGRHPDLLDALIRKGNQRVLEIVAKDILSQREWYGHPEPIEALIEKGKETENFQLLDWIHKYILTQRYWRKHPRFIELFKGEKVTIKALRELKDLWEKIKRTCS